MSLSQLGIVPMKFEHAYCTRTQTMATTKTSPSTAERIHLSGTKAGDVMSGEMPPPEFSRPEVAAELVGQ